MTMYILNIHVC